MATKASPMGSANEVSKDVTSEGSSPSEHVDAAKAATPTGMEDELGEEDLAELGDMKKVPYSRFKEVNEQKKELLQTIEALKAQQAADVRRAAEDAEARLAYKYQSQNQDIDVYDDPYGTSALESEVRALKEELAAVRGQTSDYQLKSELSRLQSKFPDADTMSVLGWMKSKPGASLEDLMEMSHTRNLERAEAKLRELVQKKKDKARKAIPSRVSPIKLDPENKPKSFKEARELVSNFAKTLKGG